MHNRRVARPNIDGPNPNLPVVVRLAGESSKVADGKDSKWYRLEETPPGGIAAPVMKLIDSLRNSGEIGTNG